MGPPFPDRTVSLMACRDVHDTVEVVAALAAAGIEVALVEAEMVRLNVFSPPAA